MEEKLKKVTTEKAPVAGQRNGGGERPEMTTRQQQELIQQALRAGASGDLRSLNEFNNLLSQTRVRHDDDDDMGGIGAAAAAGVLTAVDEDGEGDEEATVPDEFEYFTDSED
ncbi:hypothetical protein VDGD_20029 [Verticillium dahliae]|nr:hypothetical protein VDGD_20029 [Verticillium dahliae]